MGTVFHYSDHQEMLGHVREQTELGVLISGIQEPKNAYNAEAVHADLFLLKGMVESLLGRIGIRGVGYSATDEAIFDGPESLDINASGNKVGRMGKLSKKIVKEYDLRNDAWIALFNYEPIYQLARQLRERPAAVQPLPKYPSIERDIAIMLSEGIEVRSIMDLIRSSAPNTILQDVSLFDQFQSKEMKSAHERSLAFHLLFRSDDRTLEEHEVDEQINLIIKHLAGELHACLRV
jgi:phenylalanyl-tRNA synthetase beta chain